jgi:hypothetical protein
MKGHVDLLDLPVSEELMGIPSFDTDQITLELFAEEKEIIKTEEIFLDGCW